MKAIVTKYHPATNYKGSRVSARAEGVGRIFLSWADELDTEGNHDAAALALCRKFDWRGELAEGGLPDLTGNVYVFCHRSRPDYSGEHKPPAIVGPFRS